ncbi:hypothetical protein SDRG_16207 [Saprolegnia diclina VS20]|uniref:Uncharacterized protein n=1 Tax=Saprolegnia diclina (strain VS20) TaxID=1156394 RepID=T0PY41_SAPDV|nr:hypothetical protein SDRG_16207 [Saprolegnia diclina VS20]EQC25950.1 hypothetical protein SDRG_16207 [Saprolegnia diclina VS20]|eukprot:XP_008620630.1 hypothetical protein SDRG_16207 [Saprolegnia diclina VS20]
MAKHVAERCAYEAAVALVHEPGAFVSTGALPQSPPFLIRPDPSALPIPSAAIAFAYDEGFNSMLETIEEDITRDLAPTGEMQLVLSHMAIDSVGDAATFKLLPTNDANDACTFGSLIVLLPSMHEGGVITCTHGSETASFDVETSPVVTAFAAAFLSTSFTSAPITSGRRVALVFRLSYDEAHDNMRLAAPNQEPAIAAFTALAHSPFLTYQCIGKPVAYPTPSEPPSFEHLESIDKGLVDVLLVTKCFDVGLVVDATYYCRAGYVLLHPACGVPDIIWDTCKYRKPDLTLGDSAESSCRLIFWPKHHRVVLGDWDDALEYLAIVLLGDAPDDGHGLDEDDGYLGLRDVDVILRAAMTTFGPDRRLPQDYFYGRRHPLAIMARLLAHQDDLDLTLHFVANIVSFDREDVSVSDVALWLHGLLTTHGWGPFLPALLQLLPRLSKRHVLDVLHLLTSFVGLDDAPLHVIFKRNLLLEAYVTNTAPHLARANYIGHRLPPALVSAVDAFVLPPPPSVAPLFMADRSCNFHADIAVGLASAIQRDPTIARSPLVAHVLDAFRARTMTEQDVCDLEQAGLDVAGSLMYLALFVKRLDDAVFLNLTRAWGLGLLPVARTIATKFKELVAPALTSRIAAYIVASSHTLAEKEMRCRMLRCTVYAPDTSKAHKLVRDAIELLRWFAIDELLAFLDVWCDALWKTLRETDQLLLPLANLFVHVDAPLCRRLFALATTKPSANSYSESFSYAYGSRDVWGSTFPRAADARSNEAAVVDRVATVIATLQAQLCTSTKTTVDVKNDTTRQTKRQRR